MFGDSVGWTPHATMLIDEKPTVLEAENVLLSDFKEFVGKVEKVYLYEFFPSRYIECSMLGIEGK